jgi:glutamate-ammonia-ligase adenylyltransferase
MLRDSSGAAERMTKVLSNSRLATGLFERIPEAAAWFEDAAFLQPQQPEILLAELQAIGERQTSLEDSAASARQVRRRETLRIAMGAVLGELSIDQIQLALSQLSELYLQTILGFVLNSKEHAQELQSIDFAIVAMGRFGGEELGFGSDADIMYVYESMDDSDEAQRAAELVVSLIKKLSADNLLEFDIDIDLRPEGKNGAIVRSLAEHQRSALRNRERNVLRNHLAKDHVHEGHQNQRHCKRDRIANVVGQTNNQRLQQVMDARLDN